MMQYHQHSIRCSAANIIHVYIVDSLFGSMFTNGIGRAADVLYARGSAVHFALNPPQPGRERITCKHRNNVYNKNVSGIINSCIHVK